VISDNLSSFYKLNFDMIHEFNYSLTEIENMMPWERDIFTYMIVARMKEKKEAEENGR